MRTPALWSILTRLCALVACLHAPLCLAIYDKADELKYALENQKWVRQIQKGDFTCIDQFKTASALRELYFLLGLTREYGEHRDAARGRIIEAIRAIPGHAEHLGAQIDKLADDKKTQRSIEWRLGRLGEVASPEAIREIGRFLFDERTPNARDPSEEQWFMPPAAPVYISACNNLYRALGANVPFKSVDKLGLSHEEMAKLQAWWKSDASLPYRQPKVKAAAATPTPPASQPPSTAPIASLPEQQSGQKWLWITLLVLAALAAVIAARRMGRG